MYIRRMSVADPHDDTSSEKPDPREMISFDHFYQLVMMDPVALQAWMEAYPPSDKEKLDRLAQERIEQLQKKSARKKSR